jgi:hypothetical protein
VNRQQQWICSNREFCKQQGNLQEQRCQQYASNRRDASNSREAATQAFVRKFSINGEKYVYNS